jgi:hypothetical protein
VRTAVATSSAWPSMASAHSGGEKSEGGRAGGTREAEGELGHGARVSASTLTRGEGSGAWHGCGCAAALH